MFDEQANMGEGRGLNRRNFNSIQSIEGIAAEPKFDSHCKWDAMQCGYCTPGMLVIAKSLKNPNPKEEAASRRLRVISGAAEPGMPANYGSGGEYKRRRIVWLIL